MKFLAVIKKNIQLSIFHFHYSYSTYGLPPKNIPRSTNVIDHSIVKKDAPASFPVNLFNALIECFVVYSIC